MNTLHIQSMTDADLLTTLCGPSGQKLAGKSLSELFGFGKPHQETLGVQEDRVPYIVHPQIAAAKELYLRAMIDDMKVSGIQMASVASVRSFLCGRMGGLEYEVFWCLFLDSNNRLITAEELFRGTLTQTSVYPREVVKAALAHNASAVIFAHNHPSGNPTPSYADENLTQCLKTALGTVDVRVLDHMIVAGNDTASMSELGMI